LTTSFQNLYSHLPYARRVLEGRSPSQITTLPLSFLKERGIKGVRMMT